MALAKSAETLALRALQVDISRLERHCVCRERAALHDLSATACTCKASECGKCKDLAPLTTLEMCYRAMMLDATVPEAYEAAHILCPVNATIPVPNGKRMTKDELFTEYNRRAVARQAARLQGSKVPQGRPAEGRATAADKGPSILRRGDPCFSSEGLCDRFAAWQPTHKLSGECSALQSTAAAFLSRLLNPGPTAQPLTSAEVEKYYEECMAVRQGFTQPAHESAVGALPYAALALLLLDCKKDGCSPPPFLGDAVEHLEEYKTAMEEGYGLFDPAYLFIAGLAALWQRDFRSRYYLHRAFKVHLGSSKDAWKDLCELLEDGTETATSLLSKVAKVAGVDLDHAGKPKADNVSSGDTEQAFDVRTFSGAAALWEKEKQKAADSRAGKGPDGNLQLPPCPSMDELMSMVGLESVKMSMLALYKRVLDMRTRNFTDSRVPLNFRMVGNPGTGKTEVGKILGKILAELELRVGNESQEKIDERVAAAKAAQEAKDEEQKVDLVKQSRQLDKAKAEYALKSTRDSITAISSAVNTIKASGDVANNLAQTNVKSMLREYAGTVDTLKGMLDRGEQAQQDKLKQLRAEEQRAEEAVRKAQEVLDGASKQADDAAQKAKAAADAVPKPGVDRYVSVTGVELQQQGPTALEDIVKPMLEAKPPGGTVFIDEAHQLLQFDTTGAGKKILNSLLRFSWNNRDCMTFLLAGYPKDMEDLIESDDGFASRFPEQNLFRFTDYTASELASILKLNIAGKNKELAKSRSDVKWVLADERLTDIAARRVARGAGRKGFGNARTIGMLLDSIFSRNSVRVMAARDGGKKMSLKEQFTLTVEDILGREPDISTSPAYKKLEGLVGLGKVKEQMRLLVKQLHDIWEDERNFRTPQQIPRLNKLFLGPPGTGKTTVAKIYAELLADCGFITNGDVILSKPSDFVGAVIGESESKTAKMLAKAKGKVLVIDEAYGLHGTTSYHEAVQAGLCDGVPADAGADIAVVMIGYKDEMRQLLLKGNPGLSRRFNEVEAFTFEAYNAQELRTLMVMEANKTSMRLPFSVAKAAAVELAKESMLRNFGNADAAKAMYGRMVAARSSRLEKAAMDGKVVDRGLTLEDLEAVTKDTSEVKGWSPPADLKRLIDSLASESAFRVANGLPPAPLPHCLFVGPPGTGKSVGARYLAKMLKKAGILPKDIFVERMASELQAKYVGQTNDLVLDLIKQAQGGVLMVDEAPQLADKAGSFKKETIDTLLSAITNPDYENKFIIVFTGYEDDMERLLDMDPGLRRRFKAKVRFQDLTPEEAASSLYSFLEKDGYSIEEAGKGKLVTDFFADYIALNPSSWGNLGAVKTMCERLLAACASRVTAEASASNGQGYKWNKVFTVADIQQAAAVMLASAVRAPVTEASALKEERIKKESEDQKGFKYDSGQASDQAPRMGTSTAARTAASAKGEPTRPKEKEEHKREHAQAGQSEVQRCIFDALNAEVHTLLNIDQSRAVEVMKAGPSHPEYAAMKAKFDQLNVILADTSDPRYKKLVQAMKADSSVAAAAALAKGQPHGGDGSPQSFVEAQLALLEQEKQASEGARMEAEAAQAELEACVAAIQQFNASVHAKDSREAAEELARLKKAEEEARQRAAERQRRAICGICGRGNWPGSGCAYGGNSPRPVYL